MKINDIEEIAIHRREMPSDNGGKVFDDAAKQFDSSEEYLHQCGVVSLRKNANCGKIMAFCINGGLHIFFTLFLINSKTY